MAFFPKNIFHVSNTYNFEENFLGYCIEIFGDWKIVFGSIASYFYYFPLLVKSVLADTDKTFPLSVKPIYLPIPIYRPIPIPKLYRSHTDFSHTPLYVPNNFCYNVGKWNSWRWVFASNRTHCGICSLYDLSGKPRGCLVCTAFPS